MRPKILLLQARDPGDPMKSQEVLCFAEKTGLPAENIVSHDLCIAPPTLRDVLRHDALMVGGSGDHFAREDDLPEFAALLDVLREVADRGHPTFASCFGYQCMVQALGGEVIHDPDRTEAGTFSLSLTPEGARDELFRHLPRTFSAQLGHKDRTIRQPDGIPNLASSERSPYQALRVPGKPVWASQFHPELDHQTNRERFEYYAEGYAASIDLAELQSHLDSIQESPETSSLLPRFLRLVF